MRKGIGGHQSTRAGSVSWLTPPEILRAIGPFDYDPCPCLPQPWPTAFRVEHGDGLTADWHGRVFLNPPYGAQLGAWLSRLADHGDGIAVAFARTETRAFFRAVWGRASGLLFLRGRVHFHRPDGARARGNAGGPTVLIAYGARNAEILRAGGRVRRGRPGGARGGRCGPVLGGNLMRVADVLAGRALWACVESDALAFLRSLPDRCVSLAFFSPPYSDARTYGVGFKLRGQAWVDWLRPIVREAARVSNGLVAVNATAPVKKQKYTPAVEWLVADLTRHDGLVCGPSPYAWVRSGTPGSGNRKYQRRNWEPVYCFALPDRIPLAWTDNTAFGKPPKYGPGGECSNRLPNGARVNQWGGRTTSGRGRKANGDMQAPGRPSHKFTSTRRRQGTDEREVMTYTPPTVANPGNVIRTHSGKGHMGSDLAHENEAPMVLAVAERFVCWFVPPGGVVCDPFAGSGTTLHAATAHGRRAIGCDVRKSQVDLCARRMRTVTPPLFSEEI